MGHSQLKKTALASALLVSLVLGNGEKPQTFANVLDDDVVKLRLLETTDIHVNLMNYDYYQDKEVDKYGLARTASLIKDAREESANSMLFDNGDLIQGNPLGDYVAKVKGLNEGEVHPVYKAMNLLQYDAGNIGNHEFNYGLDFLGKTLKGAEFPYVNANVYKDDGDNNPDNDKNYFQPYLLLDKKVKDEDGEEHTIKVGVIGFVPPQIMNWDKAHLEGKVIAKDIVQSAKKFVPEMKAKGADVIVAIPHSGLGTMEEGQMKENATYDLTKVEGIDAVLFGHSHGVFPSSQYKDLAGADVEKGTVNGVAAVMPGFWGSHLGIVDLELNKENGKWQVRDSQSQTRSITTPDGKAAVESDKEIVRAVKNEHEGTLDWVRSAVGRTTAPITSYFALVQDDPSVQIVANAQKWYLENKIKGTEYENVPVLSAAAPFKAGARMGPDYYTEIPAGDIAIKNVSDLYLYPNTLSAVLVDGADVKEWLEMAAGQFNQIDPAAADKEQPLINASFPTFNFDVIEGVAYDIDVTQPTKYSADGKLLHPNANRIKNLTFNGKAIDPKQKFLVATNNYRAGGGGNFPGISGKNIAVETPDESRGIVIDYIMKMKEINPAADKNWAFAPIKEEVHVTFETSPNAKKYIGDSDKFAFEKQLDSGFAQFSINMKREGQPPAQTEEFKDVPKNHWAYTYIQALAEKGIILGKNDGRFAPNASVKRGEYAAFLARVLDLKAKGASPFTDVPAHMKDAVTALYEAGIVSGMSEKSFAPHKPVTREQMAAMTVKALEVKTGQSFKASQPAAFKDNKRIHKPFQETVAIAVEQKLISGYKNRSFLPKKGATRAEAAKVIYTLDQYKK
ncbi:bifunctional 2',3'-cyclic-nucleotide 2'-phosphodiesterase/3'-nucleotidase [Bacillus xiapuensis]|uniref:bifunctional 2',3'-cyclic-nucleotide 2'-phosphodiesterase/3'-nucleotidase n=1 Tax=Bacillus xiapuensis TaxID=2014075 RepID=UPI000C24CB41|nr:bifunctional 2',3'-cyclic-nucleotide 2'-phosphodiesterase/3'-nucleotidase [Bacillus xiapuensis]